MKTLSDKIHCMKHNYKDCKWVYPAEDVKESIQELKEKFAIHLGPNDIKAFSSDQIEFAINETFGEKLI